MNPFLQLFASLFTPQQADPWAGLRTVSQAGSTSSASSLLLTALQGGATLLSVSAGLQARRAEADALEADALDAETEIDLEQLQGLARRNSLKREAFRAVGEIDAAYAASGVDLSFGSPRRARREAFRELDSAMSSDMTTETTRVNRLKERADTYRARARGVRSAGKTEAAIGILGFTSDVINRG